MFFMNKFYAAFYTFFLLITGAFLQAEEVTTIEPGTLTVAVTGICMEDAPHHNCWVYQVLSSFAKEKDLELKFVEVPFDNSWELASNDIVDITATGVTPLQERVQDGATFSDYYSIVKRGLRIRAEDADRFHEISDFVGYRVGAVKGMTSELDLRNRAIEGVDIVTAGTFGEVYEMFHAKEIDAVAEGYYVFPGEEDINQLDPYYPMIDPHDLVPGEIEGNTFVIRNESKGLLEAINAFIEEKGLPYNRP